MNICILGNSKTGKTRSLSTLPGKTAICSFDPDGYSSLRSNYQVYPAGASEQALTELSNLDAIAMDYAAESAQVGETFGHRRTRGSRLNAHQLFIKDFNAFLSDERVDNVALDGLTGMSNLVLDAVLEANLRTKTNLQADFGDALNKLTEILVCLTASRTKNGVLLCHINTTKDEATGRLLQLPNCYGSKFPETMLGFFSNVFQTGVSGGSYYWITKPQALMESMGSRQFDNLPERMIQNFTDLLKGQAKNAFAK